jgi:hypothetical protein
MKYQLAEVLGFLCHTTDTTTVADAIEVIDGPDYPNWEALPTTSPDKLIATKLMPALV